MTKCLNGEALNDNTGEARHVVMRPQHDQACPQRRGKRVVRNCDEYGCMRSSGSAKAARIPGTPGDFDPPHGFDGLCDNTAQVLA